MSCQIYGNQIITKILDVENTVLHTIQSFKNNIGSVLSNTDSRSWNFTSHTHLSLTWNLFVLLLHAGHNSSSYGSVPPSVHHFG